MSGPVGVAGDQLRAIVERIEHVEDEIKELTEARREIYLEAKGNGFDVKILREVIRIRKQDQKERDEQDSLLDAYLRNRADPVHLPAGGRAPDGLCEKSAPLKPGSAAAQRVAMTGIENRLDYGLSRRFFPGAINGRLTHAVDP